MPKAKTKKRAAKYSPATGRPIIEGNIDKPIIEYDDANHKYWINHTPVESVTTILDTTWPKPALTWWGMRVGLAAVVRLLQEGWISYPTLMTSVYDELITGIPIDGPAIKRGPKMKTQLEAAVIEQKLSTNHIRDAAADQGTLIHDSITIMGVEDKVPNILEFEPQQRGYVQALAKWWLEQEPEFLRQEIIIGHPEYGYAGRFDIETKGHAGRGLWDFKTSKGVYEAHFEQIDLYEAGCIRLGEDPHDVTGIIHLRPDGNYRVYTNPNPDHESALAAVNLYWHRQRNARAQPAGFLRD